MQKYEGIYSKTKFYRTGLLQFQPSYSFLIMNLMLHIFQYESRLFVETFCTVILRVVKKGWNGEVVFCDFCKFHAKWTWQLKVGFLYGICEVRETLSKDKTDFQDRFLLLGGFNYPVELTTGSTLTQGGNSFIPVSCLRGWSKGMI